MLWMKSWAEMKWRLLFGLSIPLIEVLFRHLTSAEDTGRMMGALLFLLCFVAVYVAGSGVRTKASFRATKGLDGSTFFTLSLPVTRLRLLATRVAVGLMGTAGVIVIIISILWLKFPLVRGDSTPGDLLELFVAAIVCTASFHLASVLFATFLDDVWQTFGCTFLIFAAWWVVTKLSLPPSANVFEVMNNASPLITHKLPWPAMAISLIVSAIMFLAALKVVQNREY